MSNPNKPQRTARLTDLVTETVSAEDLQVGTVTPQSLQTDIAAQIQAGTVSGASLEESALPQGGSAPEVTNPSDDEADVPEIENHDYGLADLRQKPGVYAFHVLRGNRVLFGRQRRAGDTVTVLEDSQHFRDSIGEDGRSWLHIVSSPEEQEKVYGEVRFAPGPAPDPRLLYVPVPDFVQTQEERDAWRASVVTVLDRLARRR